MRLIKKNNSFIIIHPLNTINHLKKLFLLEKVLKIIKPYCVIIMIIMAEKNKIIGTSKAMLNI